MSMSPMSPMSWPMSPISPMSWPMSPMSWLMSPMSWPMSPMSGWVQVGELGTPLPSLLPDTGKMGPTIYHMWPHATTCDHMWTTCDHMWPHVNLIWPHVNDMWPHAAIPVILWQFAKKDIEPPTPDFCPEGTLSKKCANFFCPNLTSVEMWSLATRGCSVFTLGHMWSVMVHMWSYVLACGHIWSKCGHMWSHLVHMWSHKGAFGNI